MAITTDLDGSATITLSDGYQIRIPVMSKGPSANPQDTRNVVNALLLLAEHFDKRLATLERSLLTEEQQDALKEARKLSRL
jgi:hypothetical protein